MKTSDDSNDRTFPFGARKSIEDVEEGTTLAPKFDHDGLIPVVTTDAASADVLMMGVMNAEPLLAPSGPVKRIIGAAAASASGARVLPAASSRPSSKSASTTTKTRFG